ncbi:unnamed protein product [Rotaria sp. Silwood2]|nr:unnamed protein product [Rotaria sp. Silwood2]CAF3086668.1 unnamed protein product [Rotaria sp. Silwood2]CAF4351337.1 unnamed protein product [Rotaria sp. Silwood2]CAF4382057.1 unnamed protein product [Rotaria sp. Silwood2]
MEVDINSGLEFNSENQIQPCKSFESEPETTTTTTEEFSSSIERLSTDTQQKPKSASKSKRVSVFKKQWIKDPKYARFLQECKTNPHFSHCSICKSDFSIANGGTCLINRHIEQIGHKCLLVLEDKEKSRSMREFITPSTLLTKLTAAELSLIYHGVHHSHSYVSQSCVVDPAKNIFDESVIGQNISCGKTKARDLSNYSANKKTLFFSGSFDGSNEGNIKMFPFIINYFTIQSGITRSVLEVNEQPRETADHIVKALYDALQKK